MHHVLGCISQQFRSVELSRSFPPFMNGIRMTPCHARRKCSLPERAAENILHTWQHWLKIAQKPLIHHCGRFAGQLWDPWPFWSKSDDSDHSACSPHTCHHHLCPLWSISFPLKSCLSFGAFINQVLMDFSKWKLFRKENPSSNAKSHQSYFYFLSLILALKLPSSFKYIGHLICGLVWAKSLFFLFNIWLYTLEILFVCIDFWS